MILIYSVYLPCENTQKVNQQNIGFKNLGFILVVRWAEQDICVHKVVSLEKYLIPNAGMQDAL